MVMSAAIVDRPAGRRVVRRIPAALALAALPLALGACATTGPNPAEAQPPGRAWPDELTLTSERSGYRATETHAEIVAILDELADRSPLAARATLGVTHEGRDIPLLIIADPPAQTPQEARAGGRIVVYLQACIHGGEVCGKPALVQLAREILLDPASEDRALLDDLALVICPVYNADGNDRIAPGNRGPAQNGPELGMGQRANAQGLDLNRDHMKLESPEARALARFLTEWNPELTIDCHTTDGSRHGFALTYAAPLNPSGHPAPIELTRDRMLPEVSRRLEARTGLRTYFYGNFDRDMTVWATYSHKPRFATPYRGLRGRMSVLSEAYAYDTYEQRVRSTREFVRQCLRWAAEHRVEITQAVALAERATVSAPTGDAGDEIGIRYEIAAFDEPAEIPAMVPAGEGDGRPARFIERTVTVEHFGRFEPTLAVARPAAYVLPGDADEIVDTLERHGVRVERLAHDAMVDAEVYTVQRAEWSERPFQGHRLATVDVSARRERARAPAGSWVVPMDQPLANLIVYLLEPASDDGLATWGFMDGWLVVGADLPILRAMTPLD
ncbi:MAG: hypothetical protein D6693_09445 [Planctomycetota bacterium]|nr:MAG: hypothetical protein D6693_09445 [Planctomycetota bacterium]